MWVSRSSIGGAYGVYGTKNQYDPDNVPGSRYLGFADMNSDFTALFVFAGFGFCEVSYSSGPLNDLLMLDLGTKQWVWISGSSNVYDSGVKDSVGVSSPSAYPSSRASFFPRTVILGAEFLIL
jgi:hypothetical protein